MLVRIQLLALVVSLMRVFLEGREQFFGTAVMFASCVLLILQNCASSARSAMETTFTLGESSEDMLENVFYGTEDKKNVGETQK